MAYPFIYFDNVTGTNNPSNAYGIAHVRPYSEFATDLSNNTVARYNFVTPDICHSGHNAWPPMNEPVSQMDSWLAGEIPRILNSKAYSHNGALFITWDEGNAGSDGPIGMILLSPLERGGGYFNRIHYNHSSLLRTVQEIFGVTPLLGDAAKATDLSDLFRALWISSVKSTPGGFQLTLGEVEPDKTNIVQASTNLLDWEPISTNWSATNGSMVLDSNASNFSRRFYRLEQLP